MCWGGEGRTEKEDGYMVWGRNKEDRGREGERDGKGANKEERVGNAVIRKGDRG